MMITMTEIPPELEIDKVSDNIRAFCASFDFYDMMIGIAFDLDTMELIPQMWFLLRLMMLWNLLVNGLNSL